MLLVSQTTSSHFPSHTALGACGGCSFSCTFCHIGYSVQHGAMRVCDMAPHLIFAVKCLVSLCAGECPMLVCHVVCKSHIGLVALFTLGSREGVPLPGHLPLILTHGNPPTPQSLRPGPSNIKIFFFFLISDILVSKILQC